MYVCIHICTYTLTYLFIHTHLQTYIHVYVYTQIHIYSWIYIYINITNSNPHSTYSHLFYSMYVSLFSLSNKLNIFIHLFSHSPHMKEEFSVSITLVKTKPIFMNWYSSFFFNGYIVPHFVNISWFIQLVSYGWWFWWFLSFHNEWSIPTKNNLVHM